MATRMQAPCPPRPRVLIVTDIFLPGFQGGGPVRSLANMVDHLRDDFEFLVLTRDRDFREETPYRDIPTDDWLERSWGRVFYASPKRWGRAGFVDILRSVDHDVLYLPSFFSPATRAILLLRRLHKIPPSALVIGVHGQFHRAAIGHKAVRKKLYLWVSRHLGYYRNVLFHATNPVEAKETNELVGGPVHVAPNLGERDDTNGTDRFEPLAKEPGGMKLVFLSRIHPIKNLDFALRCLFGLAGQIEFDIYGPLEDARYFEACEAIIERLPPHILVTYHGKVPHTAVARILSHHHFFLLPTQTENYGYVILESLGSGCPVIISDRTPWRDLEAKGIGWDLPLDDEQPFRDVLQKCVDMAAAEHEKLARNARAFYLERQKDPSLVQQSRELFEKACSMMASARRSTTG